MKYRFDRSDSAICPCCRQPTWQPWGEFAYRPTTSHPFMFLCSNVKCQQLARKVYAMDAQTYNEIVEAAIWQGGVAGGELLGRLNKTDLGALSKPEYFEYLYTVYRATEEDLKKRIEDWAQLTGGGENG